MKDKHGKEIEVGDIVEFYDPGTGIKPTKGKVTFSVLGAIRAVWEDTNREQPCSDSDCLTLITKAASIPVKPEVPTFTQEDENMLQHLLKRKQEHQAKKEKIEADFTDAISELLDTLRQRQVFMFFRNREKADKFINVLKDYHDIN